MYLIGITFTPMHWKVSSIQKPEFNTWIGVFFFSFSCPTLVFGPVKFTISSLTIWTNQLLKFRGMIPKCDWAYCKILIQPMFFLLLMSISKLEDSNPYLIDCRFKGSCLPYRAMASSLDLAAGENRPCILPLLIRMPVKVKWESVSSYKLLASWILICQSSAPVSI